MDTAQNIREINKYFVRFRGRISELINNHLVNTFVTPALIVILLIFIYPILFLIYRSFFSGLGTQEFVALENYRRMIDSPLFGRFVQTTLLYSFGSLIVSLTTGLILALALNKINKKWMRTIYLTLILFAWAVPLAILAVIIKFVLQGTEFGLLNMVLLDLGILHSPHAWLADTRIVLAEVTLVDAWIRMPFAMIVFLAGLQSIPQHMYEAAEVDGATTFQMFRNITVPYLRPYFAIVGLINWMFAFRAFSAIFPLTQGGPAFETTTLAIFIHNVTLVLLQPGYGAAISMFLVIVTLVIATFYVRIVLQRLEE